MVYLMIFIYVVGMGVALYMLILLANFLRAGTKAFNTYNRINGDNH